MASLAGFLIFATIIATKLGLSQGKKHPYKEAKLVHGKRAYIEFYAFSDCAGTLIRKRLFCPAKYKTPAMVERWANDYIPQINQALENGLHFKSSPDPGTLSTIQPKTIPAPLLIEALKDVLKDKKAQVRSKTLGTYQSVFNKFEAFIKSKNLQSIAIGDFTNAHAYDYRNYLTGICENSNKTANNNITCTKLLFEGAIEKGFIVKNPMAIKMLPETDSDQHEVFEPKHQTILEDYLKANDFNLYVFTRMLYYAFLRPAEIRGLRLFNIDLAKRVIDVPGKIAKNRRTDTIPINQSLFNILLEYSKSGQNINNHYLFGKGIKIDRFPLGINHAYKSHKAALIACGLQDYNYTLYSWKHTGASRAYEVTKDILRLSKLLRHASTKETENYLRSIGVRLKSDPLEYDW
ncbi:MAG: phage integrase SAM-like domain-containing protein [Spirosomataceae bacterium]